MKFKTWIPLLIGAVCFASYPVLARSSEEPVPVESECQTMNEDSWSQWDDNEKVLPLGDGFLSGEAWMQDGDHTIYLNSETDPNAITVKEAKEIWNMNNSN